jgi:hypothetical protein
MVGDGNGGFGSFVQSGGTNAVPTALNLGIDGSGVYRISGGLLDVRSGTMQVGGGGRGTFQATGGSVLAGRVRVTDGEVRIGADATVRVHRLMFDLELSAATVLSFELGEARSASISGLDAASSAEMWPVRNHLLDLQTGAWRPREGDVFYVLTGFGSISGAFYDITTNITGGQQVDPNTLLPIPFFAAGTVTDPNAPSKFALRVTFQGLTAGDANGDHAVNGGDLALIGSHWMASGMGWGDCDFNGDGTVDGGDLALMESSWWWSASPDPPAPGVPLPEPATLLLLSAGAADLVRRRR